MPLRNGTTNGLQTASAPPQPTAIYQRPLKTFSAPPIQEKADEQQLPAHSVFPSNPWPSEAEGKSLLPYTSQCLSSMQSDMCNLVSLWCINHALSHVRHKRNAGFFVFVASLVPNIIIKECASLACNLSCKICRLCSASSTCGHHVRPPDSAISGYTASLVLASHTCAALRGVTACCMYCDWDEM